MNEFIELLKKSLDESWNLKDGIHQFCTTNDDESLFVTSQMEKMGYKKKRSHDFVIGLFDQLPDGHILLIAEWSFLNSMSSSWRDWVDDQVRILLGDAMAMESFGYEQISFTSFNRDDKANRPLIFRNKDGYGYLVHHEHGSETSIKEYPGIKDAVVNAEKILLNEGQDFQSLAPQLRDLLIMRE